jgi:hypothetical protein
MPLRATDLHAAARRALDRPLAELGFRRTPKTSTASWLRDEGDRWLILWFQPSRWNGPGSAGFKFTVELRLVDRPVLYAAGPLARLPTLLEAEDGERLRQMENRVIARLQAPDAAFLRSLPEAVRTAVLEDWRPRIQPYRSDEDVWFRLYDQDDLAATLGFIARVLPGALDRFVAAQAVPGEGPVVAPGSPDWDRLVAEFDDGPGARIRQAVQASTGDGDALDEALALWQEAFAEWLSPRGLRLGARSPDVLASALGLERTDAPPG